MNKIFFNGFKNILKISVSGKNIDRFIRKLVNKKITLLDIKYIKHDEVVLKIYAKDLTKIEEIKTIYNINIVDEYGIIKIKKIFRYYKLLLINLVIGFFILLFLMNIITKVEVIHSDTSIRELLLAEVKEAGIDKLHLKKNYSEIEKIKNKILEKHKDKIEWLEIENVGTTYRIRVEERKINSKVPKSKNVNIVAKKPAIIKRIDAVKGVVTKEINSYVNKGDIVISGEIYLNEELKNVVEAKGKVYGEVWYKTQVEFPYLYYDINYTGKKKTVYSIKFLNWSFDLFNFHPFKDSKKKEEVIIKHPFLPFRLVKEEQMEVIKKDQVYTIEEAKSEAKKLAIKKMEDKLGVNEYIIDVKDLKMATKNSKIRLDLFFTICEDITDQVEIDTEEIEKKMNEQKIKQE